MELIRELTQQQRAYLARNPEAVVTWQATDRWVLVESRSSLGEEGSGVWLDLEGQERYP